MYLEGKRQKRIAVINDFSGFGRCSLTVSLPVISAAGIQCCALPTAVLSNHTGYEDYFFDDYTDKMKYYYSKWEKLHLEFDGIYTGFLGSERQVDIVSDFISRFCRDNTKVIVDPVMGDDGRTYATLTPGLCKNISRLIRHSDIITPNLTEACILLGESYEEISQINDYELLVAKIESLIDMFLGKGIKKVVITGIEYENRILNFVKEYKNEMQIISNEKIGISRAGTGDVFSAIIAADAINKLNFYKSVERASDFVEKCIKESDIRNVPAEDGVCFEELLGQLR